MRGCVTMLSTCSTTTPASGSYEHTHLCNKTGSKLHGENENDYFVGSTVPVRGGRWGLMLIFQASLLKLRANVDYRLS